MRCHDCGVERDGLHKHHIVPKSLGGSNDPSNLVTLCANCHEDRHGGPCGGILKGRLSNSPEAQAKRTQTMRALWADPAYRARQLVAQVALHTPEVNARRGAGVRKWWADPDNHAKGTAVKRAIARDPARRAKISAYQKARVHGPASPETKARQSAAARARPPASPETNAKIGASLKQVWTDPEQRALRTEAMRERWTDPNYRERVLAARGQGGSHCRRGHPFDETNTRIDGRGRRACRTCHTEATRASWRRRHPGAAVRGPYRKAQP